MKQLVSLSLAVLVLAAGCSSDSEGPTTTTSTTEAAATTTTTITTTTTVPTGEGGVVVYLMFEGTVDQGGPFVVPVYREGPSGLEEALETLMRGITFTDSSQGLSTSIPTGTRYLGVEVSGGVAAIDLSREFESGGGSLSMITRVAQIVFTATRFDGIDAVLLSLEGTPLQVLGGEGLIIDEPQTRSGYLDLIPEIWIDSPAWGTPLTFPATASGVARASEGDFAWALIDPNGAILADGTAACGADSHAPFEFTISDGLPAGPAALLVFDLDDGGGQQYALEYPMEITGP